MYGGARNLHADCLLGYTDIVTQSGIKSVVHRVMRRSWCLWKEHEKLPVTLFGGGKRARFEGDIINCFLDL